MKLDRHSLAFKLVVPLLAVIALTTILLLVLIGTITHQIEEDYFRFLIGSRSEEAANLLRSALDDLTAARLTEIEPVVEAKKQSTIEALKLLWRRQKSEGIVLGAGGTLIMSTLPPHISELVLRHRGEGFFHADQGEESFICEQFNLPGWGWQVISVIRLEVSQQTRPEIGFLVPLVALGAVFMAGALLLILKRTLQRPVTGMVKAVGSGQHVEPTGVTELDRIGNSFNEAFDQIRLRTTALQEELIVRTEVEAEVRAKQAHINRLLDFTAEGIYGTDTNGVCTFVNRSCLRILGHESEDAVLGRVIHDVIHHTHPNGRPYPASECRAYLAFRQKRGIHVSGEVFWRADGTRVPVEYWAFPVIESGEVVGAVVTFIDVSERSKLEEQLFHAQKMEAIGHLAGGIAHDFNNMLSVILGYTQLARDNMPADHAIQGYLEPVQTAGEKAAELTSGLLAFSRKQVMKPAPSDLNGLVTKMEKILRRVIGETIELRTSIMGRDLNVMVDRGQVDQVIMNLVTNARDAMPAGGKLLIETGSHIVDEETARAHQLEKPGPYAYMSVSDTGAGMDAMTREKIFEPFYTTKGLGKGTGLGLSIVYGIIQQHKGFIHVYSEPGHGTTFKVYFPMIGVHREEEDLPLPPRGGTETLLVGEDDTDARNMLKVMLEDQGYTVLLAENGAEAVQIFEQEKEHIAAVLMDVIMPVMNGREACKRIRSLRPDIKVIFMSGYPDDLISRQGVLDSDVEYLQKPMSLEKVLRTVRRVLDGAGDRKEPAV